MKPSADASPVVARVAADCIAVRVRLLNRVISAVYDEALRPFGLRISQGNLLVVVGQLGEARPAAVCRQLRIEKSTLSRDVELMKRQGWLVSDPPGGGKNHILRVTAQGHALLVAVLPAWESAQDRARELLGDTGVAELDRMARRLGFEAPPG